MKKMESFLVLFYVLDQCYEMCQENDLGGFLGMISPEMLEDGYPVDTAVYVDWKSFCTNYSLNYHNITNVIYDFLKLYEREFGFDFKKTKKILLSEAANPMAENARNYVNKMYGKYFYAE